MDSRELEGIVGYHGVTKEEAKELILPKVTENGWYLLRPSTEQQGTIICTICVTHGRKILNYRVNVDTKKRKYYINTLVKFSSLADLVSHYKQHALNEASGSKLVQPIGVEDHYVFMEKPPSEHASKRTCKSVHSTRLGGVAQDAAPPLPSTPSHVSTSPVTSRSHSHASPTLPTQHRSPAHASTTSTHHPHPLTHQNSAPQSDEIPELHGNLSKILLKAAMQPYLNLNGYYLLRPSTTDDKLTLSVSHTGSILNFKINRNQKGYYISPKKTFSSVQELIKYHGSAPIKSKQRGGQKILLKWPIPVDPNLTEMVDGEAAEQQQQPDVRSLLNSTDRLPHPWQQYHSQEYNKLYYYNPETKATTWERPWVPSPSHSSNTLPRSFPDKAKRDKIQRRPLPSVPQVNGSAADLPAPLVISPSLSKRNSLPPQQRNQRPIPATRKRGMPLPPLPGSCDSSGPGVEVLHVSSPSAVSTSEKLHRRHSLDVRPKKKATDQTKSPVVYRHSQMELQAVPTRKPAHTTPAHRALHAFPQPSVPSRDSKPLPVKEETKLVGPSPSHKEARPSIAGQEARHLLEKVDLSRPHVKPPLPEKDDRPRPLLSDKDERPRPPVPDKDDLSRPLNIKDYHGSPALSNKADQTLVHIYATPKPLPSIPTSRKSRWSPPLPIKDDHGSLALSNKEDQTLVHTYATPRPLPSMPTSPKSRESLPLPIKDDHGSLALSNKEDQTLVHTYATPKPLPSIPTSPKSRGRPKIMEYEDVPQFKDRISVAPPNKILAQYQNGPPKDGLYLTTKMQPPPAKVAPALPEKDTACSSVRVPPPLPEKENSSASFTPTAHTPLLPPTGTNPPPPPPPPRSIETHLSTPPPLPSTGTHPPPTPPPYPSTGAHPPPTPPPVIPPPSSLLASITSRSLSVSSPPPPPPPPSSDPSDGRPFTANDLVTGFQRLKKVENGSENRGGTYSGSRGGLEETFHRVITEKFRNTISDSEEEYEDVDDDEWDD